METWMFPALVLLQPSLANMTANYRVARNKDSQARSTDAGFNGSDWAWESSFTGFDTSPSRSCGTKGFFFICFNPLTKLKKI